MTAERFAAIVTTFASPLVLPVGVAQWRAAGHSGVCMALNASSRQVTWASQEDLDRACGQVPRFAPLSSASGLFRFLSAPPKAQANGEGSTSGEQELPEPQGERST